MSPFRVAALGGMALLLSACAGGPLSSPGDGGDGLLDRSWAVPGSGAAGRPAATALDELKGLTSADVERRFGPPSFRRADAPAEMWQYRTRTCSLDLFLYREQNKGITVSHAAVRGPSGAAVGETDCLKAVQSARVGQN
ncbi:hypothetical protein [Magnetospirillum molischianum]|uniref:Lipoprotein SmpA/OmlA domain-containing protein n=1 Tax=Magnetospirillum molischianum DSM 120 TaxID=1150626 RepID=H8FTH7_MAGML|nr:hypothetical protein [Magnetospirillum molischianum]CCG41665.1 conserved exported hypothetical protein [Magnetospirillum molischianum DSM 120]